MMQKKCVHTNKGRILRVKEGFNPNSSSMGSIVYAMPAAAIALATALGTVSAVVGGCVIKKNDEHDDRNQVCEQANAIVDEATGDAPLVSQQPAERAEDASDLESI
jgi:hypothetical protein